jgi:hypothetical protein
VWWDPRPKHCALKILRRIYNQIEDGLNRIDRQESEHQYEHSCMQFNSAPIKSTNMAFKIQRRG